MSQGWISLPALLTCPCPSVVKPYSKANLPTPYERIYAASRKLALSIVSVSKHFCRFSFCTKLSSIHAPSPKYWPSPRKIFSTLSFTTTSKTTLRVPVQRQSGYVACRSIITSSLLKHLFTRAWIQTPYPYNSSNLRGLPNVFKHTIYADMFLG